MALEKIECWLSWKRLFIFVDIILSEALFKYRVKYTDLILIGNKLTEEN